MPSREDVLGYDTVRNRVEQLVGTINGDFGELGRPVVQYIHKSLPFSELLVLYRAADVLLVTPFQDGMNLVAKEYVAARVDDRRRARAVRVRRRRRGAHRLVPGQPVRHRGPQGPDRGRGAHGRGRGAQRMAAMRRQVENNDLAAWAKAFLALLAMA